MDKESCESCGCEMESSRELISKLVSDIYELVYEYDTQMPLMVIAHCFIMAARDLVCSKKLSYTVTIGLLTEMMTEGLRELLESHLETTDKEE